MPEDNDSEEEQTEEEQKETSPLDDAEFLREHYHDEDLTQAEIGELDEVTDFHGGPVTSSTVSHYMKKHEVETRANVVDDERLEDEEWLTNAYLGEDEGGEGEQMTMQEIADEIGCSDGTVMRRLHDIEGLEIRRSATAGDDDEDEEGDEEADEAEEAEAEAEE